MTRLKQKDNEGLNFKIFSGQPLKYNYRRNYYLRSQKGYWKEDSETNDQKHVIVIKFYSSTSHGIVYNLRDKVQAHEKKEPIFKSKVVEQ